MTVSQKKYTHGVVLVVAGRLDSLTSHHALAAFEQYTETPAPLFVFECSQLGYVSSAGLRVFLEIAKRVKARHRSRVAIAALNPLVQEIFEIAGFTSLFVAQPALADFKLGAEIA